MAHCEKVEMLNYGNVTIGNSKSLPVMVIQKVGGSLGVLDE
jgi:hypothetical protein